MSNSLMVIRAAGNQEMVNALLPVFESPELKKCKKERDEYKKKYEITLPRRQADFASLMENVRTNYVVKKPNPLSCMLLGIYGLVICAIHGFYRGLVSISNDLTTHNVL